MAAGPAIELAEALSRAVSNNKDLAAFEFSLQEQAGRAEQSRLLQNPVLNVEIEDFTGTDDFSDFGRSQSTLSLQWALEGRIRKRRVAAAEARSSLVASDVRLLRLEVAGETAERFVESLADQQRLDLADEAVGLAESNIGAVKRRVDAGKAPKAELARAEAELAEAKLTRDDVEHEGEISRHRLAAQWGDTNPDFGRLAGEILRVPETPPFEEFQQRLDRNPEVARLLVAARVAKAEVALAKARRWPTLRPQLGVRHINSTDDVTGVAQISIQLPLFNRNQGNVAQSRASLARNRADTQAARVRANTTVFTAYIELTHNIHRVGTLRDEVIPRLAKAVDETRRGYERGRYSYLDWRSIQLELLEAKNQLIGASAAAHRLVIVLERLTGEPVAKS